MSLLSFGNPSMLYPTSQIQGHLGVIPSPDHQSTVPCVYGYSSRPGPAPAPSHASLYPMGWYGSLYGSGYQNDCVYDSPSHLGSTVASYSSHSGFSMAPYNSEHPGVYLSNTGKRNSSLMSCNSSPSSSHSPGSSAAGSPPGSLLSASFAWMNDVNSAVQSASRKERTRTKDKYRVVYTEKQKVGLEKAYKKNKFITAAIKIELSKSLSLSERQIKIWFQNRRAKERKMRRRQEECEAVDVDRELMTNVNTEATPCFSTPSCEQSTMQLPLLHQTSLPECLYQNDVCKNTLGYEDKLDQHSPVNKSGSYINSHEASEYMFYQQSCVISPGSDVIASLHGISDMYTMPEV